MKTRPLTLFLSLALLLTPVGLGAQDANMWFTIDEIEDRLKNQDFELGPMSDMRFEGDRTQRVPLQYEDGVMMLVKWAAAPRRGGEFNNRPANEVAAYEIQKLFLDPENYVVPPTVMRSIPYSDYQDLDDDVRRTFGDVNSVVVVLQYFLSSVTQDDFDDEDREKDDPDYKRHFGDFNILTYLIRHNDQNVGNFLISTAPNARVFSVDNGLAFGREESDQGFKYRNIQRNHLPSATVDRLRTITEEDLHGALGVLAQFEERDGELVQVEPTENLSPNDQVREEDGVYQFGLTDQEITWVRDRLRRLLEKVDDGDYELF
jgi:hypothetical protein